MSDANQNEFDHGIPVDGVAGERYMVGHGESLSRTSGVPTEGGVDVDGVSIMAGSFNHRGGVSDTGADGMGKEERAYDHHDGGDMAPVINGDDPRGDPGHGGDEEERPEGMSSEMETITRQAKIELEKTLGGTRDLAEALFAELSAFLEESEAIQKDMGQVQNIVHAESARLDDLEPQVENATRNFASANML